MKMPRRTVELIEDHELRRIYRENYWDACGCDNLPPALAAAVFDMAVNSGPWNAKLTLQRALMVKADGVIGPATILAAKSLPDAVLRFLKRRGQFIQEVLTTRPDQWKGVVFVLRAGSTACIDQAWKGVQHMNKDMILSLVRSTLISVGTAYAAKKGLDGASLVEAAIDGAFRAAVAFAADLGRARQAEVRMCALAVCLFLMGCSCLPRVRMYHEGMKPTGAIAGAYCPTKGWL
jgi:hypothetical protein